MPFTRLKLVQVRILAIALAVFSICVLSPSAVSQTSSPQGNYPKQIRLGIRTTSSLIGQQQNGQFGGFCGDFLKELGNELGRQGLQIEVIPQEIENQYRGRDYPRFHGLVTDKVEIECGPNSRSSLDLIDSTDNKPFATKIELSSKNFYTTGIKLLLRKETAEGLKSISKSELEQKLRELPIAVIKGTTTLKQFQTQKEYYPSYIPYPKKEQSNQKLDVRDLALDDLEKGEVQAFASDAIILRSLFNDGVEVKPGYRKSREPYKNSNKFVIYPSEPGKYLPNLDKEEYAIAINKNTAYVKWLRDIIDTVLKSPTLQQSQQNIANGESDITLASPTSSPTTSSLPTSSPTTTESTPPAASSSVTSTPNVSTPTTTELETNPTPAVSSSENSTQNGNGKNDNWVEIVVALIPAIATITAAAIAARSGNKNRNENKEQTSESKREQKK